MTPLQQRTLQIAKTFVGASENLGPNRGTRIERIQLWFGRWMLGQPWCAAYVVYCCELAAKDLKLPRTVPKYASCSLIYAWAKKNGRLLANPQPGCVFLVRKGGSGDSDGRADRGKSHIHCGFVHDAHSSGRLVTVEGNYSNRVSWNHRAASGLDFVRI